MYAAAVSFPGVPVSLPSSASLARYAMSRRMSVESGRSGADAFRCALLHDVATTIRAHARIAQRRSRLNRILGAMYRSILPSVDVICQRGLDRHIGNDIVHV